MIVYGILSKTFYVLAFLAVAMLILCVILSIAASIMERRIKKMGWDLEKLEAERKGGAKK